jgi:hypothetical protein
VARVNNTGLTVTKHRILRQFPVLRARTFLTSWEKNSVKKGEKPAVFSASISFWWCREFHAKPRSLLKTPQISPGDVGPDQEEQFIEERKALTGW